ncbi:uncharacterized protein LOC105836345 [Monomorium pharaonis]|uniref:uncharacterized protein LOC105836345 n=1 Tax=Monomorium pharaonis TaxID=307658 RepID=UPI00063F71C5|nr:uncharacterized protein LOC105836345 [Monomorium pharaonis]
MTNRVKLLMQKRTTLKSQITNLANIVDQDRLENTALKLRILRLTTQFHTFQDLNGELILIDSDGGHADEFVIIQDQLYDLAGKIDNILSSDNASAFTASVSRNESRSDGVVTTAPATKRRFKLPEATLPTFDGRHENWLSFKNAFKNMIDTETDLTDIDKLHYLKSALIGEAANKIKILSIDGTNYFKAWELLERSYEVKRLLVTRHLSLLMSLSWLEIKDIAGLTKLADDAQQYIASLEALGV